MKAAIVAYPPLEGPTELDNLAVINAPTESLTEIVPGWPRILRRPSNKAKEALRAASHDQIRRIYRIF
jgi:hypothetical protein